MPALKRGSVFALGLIVLGLLLLVVGAPPLQADNKDSQAQAPDMIIPAEQSSQEISAALQQALEGYGGGDLQGIVVLCASACQPPGQGDNSNPMSTWVKTGSYSCEGGNCSCQGAVNCVQMIGRNQQCLRSSTVCTEAGCTCKQKSRVR